MATKTPAPEAERTGQSQYAELAEFFDRFVVDEPRWRRRNETYHRLIEKITCFHVPAGARVLEIGSGSGDLLAALRPAQGVGVDVSEAMVERAQAKHPGLRFLHGAGEELDLDETFDYIVLSDLVPYVQDLVRLFERMAAHSHRRTRVVVSWYSRTWRPIIRIAELLRLKPVKPNCNWVSRHDMRNLLELNGFEVVTSADRILMPKQVPLLTILLNGFLANLWPLSRLCLTHWIVARPRGEALRDKGVSVICPCRNEQGHVREVVERLPALGAETELIFVEGGSTDDTRGEIERQIAAHPDRDLRLIVQSGQGKVNAVREGFASAKHDVLMILDADLAVAPEDLTNFYRALIDGRGEVINGSRLVYDMDPGAMRFLNTLGNRLFSRLFEQVTGQHVKDTLCGTKVLLREDYEQIAAARSYFGEFDPFGDFDLLFGAARLNLKIVDLPVRYRARAYGATNISRWSHGLLLLRMTLFAYWKFNVALFV